MKWEIRKATTEDIDSMAALLKQLFTIEKDFKPYTDRQKKGLLMLLTHSTHSAIWVATTNEKKIIGMVAAHQTISTSEGGVSVKLEDLIVQTPYRGNGVGTMLVKQVLLWAQECKAKRLELLVDVDNAYASTFYTAQGWRGSNVKAMYQYL